MHRFGEMGEKSENHEIWANFDPKQIFLGAAPKIFKSVLGTSFQGLLPEKFWTTPPDPKGLGKNFTLQILLGEAPQGVHKLDIMTHYHL